MSALGTDVIGLNSDIHTAAGSDLIELSHSNTLLVALFIHPYSCS